MALDSPERTGPTPTAPGGGHGRALSRRSAEDARRVLRHGTRVARSLAFPLVLGLVCWAVLAPLTSWSLDDSVWWWATTSGTQGIALYNHVGFSYPPLWGELLQGMGWVVEHVGIHTSMLGQTNLSYEPLAAGGQFGLVVTSPLFNLLCKGVLLLFDIATGLLLYGLTLRATGDERRARLAFSLWFLNPLVVVEASVFAGFDLMVAFFVVAAVALFVAQRPFWAGVALSLGVLAKLSPIYLLPLVVFVLLDRRQTPSFGQAVRRLAILASGFVITAAVVLAPLAATHEFNAAFHAVFNRVSTGAKVGGISVYGLTGFRGLQGVANALLGVHSLGRWLVVVQIVVSVLLGLAAARVARRDLAFAMVGGAGVILLAVAILEPVTNPQYLLWGLPCVVAAVAIWRRCAAALVLVSAAGFLLLLAISGPAMVLTPLAQYTGLLTPRQVQAGLHHWTTMRPLLWSANGGGGFLVTMCAVMAAVGTVLVGTAMLWRRAPRRSRLLPSRLHGVSGRVLCGTLAGVLLCAAVGEGVVAATPASAAVYLSAAAPTGSGTATVHANVVPGPQLDGLHLVAFTAPGLPTAAELDIYQDPHQPVSGTTQAALAGTTGQISTDLRNRGFSGSSHLINAQSLRAVLQDTATAPQRVIVDLSGVLPESVFSASVDLVTPWLQAGGTLYWGGTTIGHFSGRAGEPANARSYPGSLGAAGTAKFFNPALVGSSSNPAAIGTVPTAAASAVGLHYRFNAGGLLTTPPTAGIAPLAWVGQGRSSMTVVAVGAGRLVVLGGPVAYAALVAADIVTSFLSGVVWADGPVTSHTVSSAVVEHGGSVTWSAPVGTNPGSVIVVAVDPTIQGVLLTRTTAQ